MNTRQDQIADVFERHFHHYGFKKTTVDDVANELHISKKTIYEYFDSKEAVFAYIIQREADQASQLMAQRLINAGSQGEKITLLVDLIFEQARTYLKTTRLLDFNLNHQGDIAELSFQKAYEAILKLVIEEGAQNGEFNLHVDDLNLSFVRSVVWQGLQALKGNPDCHPEEPTSKAVLKLIR